MKVVCESCQAKYQVPDERVAGKKLKIRCKRCGATVLIRGDLVQGAFDRPSVPAESLAPVETAAPSGDAGQYGQYEWHVSLDGDTRGPFDSDELRRWLDATPGGWDAHVWREGFPDWVEARVCSELDPPPPAPSITSLQEDELPTQTFQAQSSQFLAEAVSASPRAHSRTLHGLQASAIRTSRSPSGISEPGVAFGTSTMNDRGPDEGMFGSAGLGSLGALSASTQGFASPSPLSSTYAPGPNPGFADGEGSGLIDIRALASLARQGTTQIAPGAGVPAPRPITGDNAVSYGDDDARVALSGQPSAMARVDSLAPVSTPTHTSNAALPLAILGGCALVAAAVLAAVLFTRPTRSAEVVAMSAQGAQQQGPAPADSVAATAQPPAEPPPPSEAPVAPAEVELRAAMPETHEAHDEPLTGTEEEMAAAKAKRQQHLRGTTAVDDKKPVPTDEKAKPKKEEKPEPQSTGEVMLADKAKPHTAPAPAIPAAAAAEPAKPAEAPKAPNAPADVDTLLGANAKPATPTKPQPPKNRSIDDLLNGAVDSKGAPAPAATAKPAAPASTAAPSGATSAADEPSSDLPESPSRDEVLAAMRGVESAVRACATAEPVQGTAEVTLSVAGNTGRVTSANVTGITGNVGSCIARAVRNARFPHFTRPSFTMKYPYRF